MLRMYSDFVPKFVRTFADVGSAMSEGFKAYSEAVKTASFPAAEHTFKIADEVLENL